MTKDKKLLKKNLEKIFYPDSVAIVGANKVQGTVPNDIVMNIMKGDFNGIVFPVSPRERFIAGLKAYKYVLDIPDPVDLAIIVYPSSVAHLALEQCGQKDIKSVIIISAGFKEVGGKGIEREEQLKEIADRYGMSFIGPNCLGVINTDPRSKINASFSRKMPEEGSIAFLSQSGALCTAVLDYAQAKQIGFSKFISFGNKADISEIDLLYYLKDDPKTKVILVYLEEISEGQALIKAARDVMEQSGKPVLLLKSGRTAEGASAAASHTGSLAGDDAIVNAACEQTGIIRCENIEEMFNIAIAFAYQPIPKSNKIAIITNAGGPGVLATDASIEYGLKLAKFSDETTAALKKSLPSTANIKNPVDVIGDARTDRYNAALTAAFKDPDVDGVFVILTPQSMTEIDLIAREIAKVSSHYDKPVYASFMGAADVQEGIEVLQRNKIPHYTLPENMAKSFAAVYHFEHDFQHRKRDILQYEDVDRAKVAALLNEAKHAGLSYLTEDLASQALAAYKLPVYERFKAGNEDELKQLAERLEFPAVMKIISPDIVHKSDSGGVMLNIQNMDEALAAYRTMMEKVSRNEPEARINGVLLTKMIPAGEELILGVKRDKAFGPVIVAGMGGIFVEIFRDVTMRVAPISREEAASMLKSTKGYKILQGARGRKPRDLEAIAETIGRLSQLAVDFPEISELDINPLISLEKGAFVADAKIMIQ
jgi:acetate---CoA ligase (ADP-forming)